MTKLTLSNGTVILRRELDTDVFEAVVYHDEQRAMTDAEWEEYVSIIRRELADRIQQQRDARHTRSLQAFAAR